MTTSLIIISLTTIHSRLHLLPNVINNILSQTLQPDIIHIFYSTKPLFYDSGIQLEELQSELKINSSKI